MLTVGLVQHACTENQEENHRKSEKGIREAASRGARLVVLQELHSNVYFPKSKDYRFFDRAESIPGPTTEFFSSIAAELGVVIVISLFEKRASGIYHNTAVVIEKDGSLAGKYRKTHIPDDPGFSEKFYFTPGEQKLTPISCSVGKLGVLVCWDQWYPEAARMMALSGAELLIYPTAIGSVPGQPEADQRRWAEAWRVVQRGHAVANGIPVIAVNRIGLESDSTGLGETILFWGQSFTAGGQGEILAQASADQEEVLTAEINLNQSEQIRRDWHFFRDRRVDLYKGLTQRFQDDT